MIRPKMQGQCCGNCKWYEAFALRALAGMGSCRWPMPLGKLPVSALRLERRNMPESQTDCPTWEPEEGGEMSNARKLAGLFGVLSQMTAMKADEDAAFLQRRGWVPLGAEAFTGVPGWGKMIAGHAVTVGQTEALAIEREQAAKGGG